MDPYRTEEASCAICCAAVAAGDAVDAHGVRLCAPCARGENDAALAARGITRASNRYRKETDEYLSVVVERAARLEVQLKLTREGLGGRFLGKLGLGDLKVGDPAFDDFVRIDVDQDHRAAAEMILGRADVRRAVLALLRPGREARVEIVNGLLTATVRWGAGEDGPDEVALARAALALAWLVAGVEVELLDAGAIVR